MTQTRKLMTFKHTLLAATALLGLAVSTPRAQANIFQTGDVVLFDPYGGNLDLEVFNPANYSYTAYAPASTSFPNSYTSATSFGTAGILYVAGSAVYEMNQSGVNSTFLTAAAGDTITTVMADANNNVFVAGMGPSSTNFISEYTSTGTLVSTHTFSQSGNTTLRDAALSANEQTLYFDNNGGSHLYVYNLATGTVSAMAGAAGTVNPVGVQVMPDGNILMATSTSKVSIYTSAGALVSSYIPGNSSYGVAVDQNGTGFWTTGGTTTPMYFNASGINTAYPSYTGYINDLLVIGSQNAINSSALTTQSGGSTPTSAPEPAALPLLAGMLGLLAMVKLARPGRGVG